MRLDPQFLHTPGKVCLWNKLEEDKKRYQKISADMIQLMIEQRGIGLAANQVGLNLQMFVMRKQAGDYLTCINPKLISIGTDWHGDIPMESLEEGCLSFPGVHYEIKRPTYVTVQWTDYASKDHSADLEGIDARCWLHEYDHCQGITFDQRYNGTIKEEMLYDKA
jgi:peptide deformylase